MHSQEFQDRDGAAERSFDYLYRADDFSKIPAGGAAIFTGHRLEIRWIKKGMVRVTADKKDDFDLDSTPAICSRAGRRQENVNVKYDDRGDILIMEGPELTVKVFRSPFQLQFLNEEGEIIHADVPGSALGWRRKELRCRKELRPRERIFGLGEKTGFMDKRGSSYTMWNTDEASPHVPSTDPLYVSIPFYIGFIPGSSYGLYFDNSYRSHFDMGDSASEHMKYTAEGGRLDYYFMRGSEIADVVKKFTWLTGRHPLPPLWALGYHQSRYSYYPQARVKEIAENFQQRDIPCDAIHLDIHYMDGFRVFTWDEDRFPRPGKLAGELREMGINLITIMDPGVKRDPEYDVYLEGIKNDHFCRYIRGELYRGEVWPGESVFPDFTSSSAKEWWKNLHEDYFELGIRGIWNDMNEPADFNDRMTLPDDVYHENDGDPGTHRRFHNLYAFHEAEATQKAVREFREERPFVLSRAGFAGIQRHSALWTGDNRSFWQHLEMSMPMLANLSMSGVGFSGCDVGGFSDDCSGELLTRWTQLGSVMPFFRNHTCVGSRSQEPWAFGEPYTSINRRYIRLRYELLPQIYSLFYQMSSTGVPVWRPLCWHYPEDEALYNISDQIMVGDNLLAAPVCRPDRRERSVYLPEGGWYDFWTGDYYRGGQSWIMEAPLDTMPLFVRENSLLFLDPDPGMQAPEGGFERLKINYYPARVERKDMTHLYLDDGISFAHENGEYNLYEFEIIGEEDGARLNFKPVQNNFPKAPEKVEVAICGLSELPGELKLNGQKLPPEDYEMYKDEVRVMMRLDRENELSLKGIIKSETK